MFERIHKNAMKIKNIKFSELVGIVLIVVPVLAVFMGGIYSVPAMRITKERDPWLTLLLALGLAITVFGIGLATHISFIYLSVVWLVSVVLLLIRRAAYGNLGHNLERFGMVHGVTLLIMVIVVTLKQHRILK